MATDSETLVTAAEEVDKLLDDGCDCSDIEFLSRSVNRLRILVELAKAPQSQADLQRELDIPRTTLRRNLIQLSDRQWIEERTSENVYRILPPGELVTESFHALLRDTDTADRLGSFMEYLPESLPADTETLANCTITCCHAENPYAPINRFETLLSETESFYLALPVLNPMYIDTIESRLSEYSEHELVVASDSLAVLRSEHPLMLDTFSETESAELFVSDEKPTIGTGSFDECVVAVTYSPDGRMHSVLEAGRDQRAIVDWVEQCYHSYKRTAEVYQ